MSETQAWESSDLANMKPFEELEFSPELDEANEHLLQVQQTPWEELSEDEQIFVFDESFGSFLDEVRLSSQEAHFFMASESLIPKFIPENMSWKLWISTALSYLEDQELSTELEFDDICLKQGKEQLYFYSSRFMSHNWAMSLFLQEETDDLSCFVHLVRHESQTYPRPMIDEALMQAPFCMDTERIRACFMQAQELANYQDICECWASNEDHYYYSTKYLSQAQAQALAEFYSVEQVRNV